MKYRVQCACRETGRDMVVEVDAADFRDAESVVIRAGLLAGRVDAVTQSPATAPATTPDRKGVPISKQIALVAILPACAGLFTPVAYGVNAVGNVVWTEHGGRVLDPWLIFGAVLGSIWTMGMFSITRRPGIIRSIASLLIAIGAMALCTIYVAAMPSASTMILRIRPAVGIYLLVIAAGIVVVASIVAFLGAANRGSRAAYA